MVRNLCVGCLDDQAVLLTLLHGQAERWRAATYFERRFAIQGYWEDYAGALPRGALQATPADGAAIPLAAAGAAARQGAAGAPAAAAGAVVAAERAGPPAPRLRRQVLGRWRVPFSIHFAGCQLCSGKADAERAARCWPAFRETVRFAEDQTTRPWGLAHAPEDRGGASDAPLQPTASGPRECVRVSRYT